MVAGFFSSSDLKASVNGPAEVLERLFSRVSTVRQDSERIITNDSIKYIINNYVESDSAFTHKFTNLKNLGQVTSKNSRLKIITWNLLLRYSKSRYYCYFIHNTGRKNQIYRLEGTYNEAPVRNDITYSVKNWYGALYYDLRSYRNGDQYFWVLLGIDFGNPLITRKIIDVVSFTKEGEIIFGKKIFMSGVDLKYREVLEYSSDAVASVNFINDKSIVFDHLVPVSPALKGKKEHYAPDFSYDAYYLERGIWKFRSDIDIRNRKK